MCPPEENIEEKPSKKISHYGGLLKDCINAGWKVHLCVIEVGAHGYAACSLRSCLSKLRFIQRTVRDIIKKPSDTVFVTETFLLLLNIYILHFLYDILCRNKAFSY